MGFNRTIHMTYCKGGSFQIWRYMLKGLNIWVYPHPPPPHPTHEKNRYEKVLLLYATK